MLLLIILTVLSFGCGFLVYSMEDISDNTLVIIPGAICMISGILLLVALISLPVNRLAVRADIARLQSVQQTLDQARGNKDISEFELAAIQKEIIEVNANLAECQYYNKTMFGLWYHDEIKDVKPVS